MRDCGRQNRGRSSRLRQHRFGRQRLQTRLNRRADLENCAIARIDNAAGFIHGVASYARDWEQQGSCGGSDEIVSTAIQVLGASDNAAGVDFIL